MRAAIFILVALTLTACGGSRKFVPSASGQIAQACLSAQRKSATPALCNCVQQVASKTLSASDQRRAAEFFANPDKAQSVKLSNHGPTEQFWERYKRFASASRSGCGHI